MRQSSMDGRCHREFDRGVYNWKVRPGSSGGGGNVKSSTATVTCSGVGDGTTTPLVVVGVSVPLSKPVRTTSQVHVTLTPSIITGNFAYSGGSTGYYSGGSFSQSLVLYDDVNPMDSYFVGTGFLIANPIFYVYSREGADDGINFDGATFIPSGSWDKVGINLSLVRCSVSVSYKVLIAWVE